MIELILFSLLLILVFVVEFVVILSIERKIRAMPKNKVHFYVARDNHGSLGLFIGKPPIWKGMLESGNYILIGGYSCFPVVGLDTNDYANLKYGDTPVEVFLNMEE